MQRTLKSATWGQSLWRSSCRRARQEASRFPEEQPREDKSHITARRGTAGQVDFGGCLHFMWIWVHSSQVLKYRLKLLITYLCVWSRRTVSSQVTGLAGMCWPPSPQMDICRALSHKSGNMTADLSRHSCSGCRETDWRCCITLHHKI